MRKNRPDSVSLYSNPNPNTIKISKILTVFHT